MAEPQDSVSHVLLEQAAAGDCEAAERLLAMHQERLRAMIAMRLDKRLRARVDPSDVLQETLAEAHRKLPEYARSRPIPFYPWLRHMAWEKIVHLHRQHLLAKARAVTREERFDIALPDQSALVLAERLIAKGTSPSHQMLQDELRSRVRAVLAKLDARDREVLVLRYLEQLSMPEIAAVLELSHEAVKSRHRRALERFSDLVGNKTNGGLS